MGAGMKCAVCFTPIKAEYTHNRSCMKCAIALNRKRAGLPPVYETWYGDVFFRGRSVVMRDGYVKIEATDQEIFMLGPKSRCVDLVDLPWILV